jgi:hypothetical protein
MGGEKDLLAFSHAHYDGNYGYALSPVHQVPSGIPGMLHAPPLHHLGGSDESESDHKFDLMESGTKVTNPAVERAINALKFVAQHVRNEDNFEEVSKFRTDRYEPSPSTNYCLLSHQFSDDWKYVAMVLDRILLWAFSIACFFGKIELLFFDLIVFSIWN